MPESADDTADVSETQPLVGNRITSTFSHFNPEIETWSAYKIRLKCHFTATQASPQLRKEAFLSWLDPAPFALLQSLTAPDDLLDPEITLEDLFRHFDEYYTSKPSLLASIHKLLTKKQRSGQPFKEFYAEVMDQVRQMDIHDSSLAESPMEMLARTALVIGCTNDSVHRALLRLEDPTLEVCLNRAKATEQLQQDLLEFNSSPQINRVGGYQSAPRHRDQQRHPAQQQRQPPASRGSTSARCPSCDETGHSRDACRFRNAECHFCRRLGHISKACRQKKKKKKDVNTITINAIGRRTTVPIDLKSDNIAILFDVDTGAERTIINASTWSLIGKPRLSPPTVRLKAYAGSEIPSLGECIIPLQADKNQIHTTVVVTPDGRNLLGIDAIRALQLDLNQLVHPDVTVHTLKQVEKRPKIIEDVIKEFPEVFDNTLGHCTKMKAEVTLKPDARPKFFKSRPIALAYIEPTKAELDRLESQDIVTKVKTSDWAAPMVVISKKNGKIRICGDYKVTINPQMDVDQHPLPTIDDLMSRLSGGKHFSTLDLSDAYLQIELTDESKSVVVINTPFGLYRYNRLPFGPSCAPAIFQRLMDQIIADLPGTAAYLDDIIVTGATTEEHAANLRRLLHQLSEFGLKCNLEKSHLFQTSVQYLGYVIDRNGKHVDRSRVDAVMNFPTPKTVKDVEAFLGKMNYYGPFVKNFSTIAEPLNELRRKDVKFNWTTKCNDAFTQLRTALADATLLVHFDQKLPVLLATDASEYGIGAVILHRFPDGSERPIAHASKTLNAAERNYSQIEKEALSIIYGMKKFYFFLAGRHFELITDHQPLVSIFKPDRALPKTAVNRLQRWAIFLMGFNFSISYKNTLLHANADALSRLPAGPDPSFVDDTSAAVHHVIIEAIDSSPLFNLSAKPLSRNEVADATRHCPILSRIRHYLSDRWPSKCSPDEQPFFLIREELALIEGCIVRNNQLVVPERLKQHVLRLLHAAHIGVVKMKQLARHHVWWPGINKEIDQLVATCTPCAVNAISPKREFSSWPEPIDNWERIHIDFAGPIRGSKFLLVIDAKSKYAFVQEMKKTTAEEVAKVLSAIFTLMGPPKTLVSDNGPPFTSLHMADFYEQNGIQHVTTPPYHPASNGLVERFVRSFKDAHKREVSVEDFLRTYRTSPHTTTDVSPAEAMFGRRIRTTLAILLPTSSPPPARRQLSIPEDVWVRDPLSKTWKEGTIRRQLGTNVFDVTLPSRSRKFHKNQMRNRLLQGSPTTLEEAPVTRSPARRATSPAATAMTSQPGSPMTSSNPPPLRRSARVRQPPNVLTYTHGFEQVSVPRR